VTDRPIRLLLDTSAVVAFTRDEKAIHVGEVIAEVADEGGAVGIPMLCLAAARWAVTDAVRLDVLVNHPDCVLLADDPHNWQPLAATYDIVGNWPAASVALMAVDLHVNILTAQPGLYAGLAGGDYVIDI
jgi:hypothetical protein